MKFTLGTTYYENPDYLLRFVELHKPYCDELIIVDDGSQQFKAEYYVESDDKLKLFRVKQDLGFNSHGCRNLIMKQATFDWVALIDLDREFFDNGQQLNILHTKKLSKNKVYKFVVHVNTPGNKPHLSVNEFLVHKDLFFKAGGYDEELVGMRMGDREFITQMLHFGLLSAFEDINILHTRSPSVFLKREQEIARQNCVLIDKNRNQQIIDLVESRMIKPDPNKPIINFDWEQIT